MKSNSCYQKYVTGFAFVKTFGAWGITFAFKNVTFFNVDKHNYLDIL